MFSYQAIPTETTFKAQLRLPQSLIQQLKEKNPSWWHNLHDEYRIGQSKKDDYGLIELKTTGNPLPLSDNDNSENKSSSQQNLSEVESTDSDSANHLSKADSEDSSPQQNQSDNYLYVWLLSDVLLRDSRLRPTADLDEFKCQLEQKLGVILKEREDKNLLSLMARQRRTDSWQVRWGLPRPSLVGLQAGSCFVYEVTGEIKPDKIKELEAQGIGERRAEGYGQICFNDRLLTSSLSQLKPYSANQNNNQNSSTVNDNNSQTTSNNIINPKDSSFEYARIIELEAWRDEIRLQFLAIASSPEKRYEYLRLNIVKNDNGNESKPSMSQLGNLRTVIGRLQSSSDSQRVLTWIESVSKVPNRLEKWEKGRLDTIKNLIENQNEIWTILDISEDLTITENGKQQLQQELWTEAIRIFIDACIRAHKRDWEKVSQN